MLDASYYDLTLPLRCSPPRTYEMCKTPWTYTTLHAYFTNDISHHTTSPSVTLAISFRCAFLGTLAGCGSCEHGNDLGTDEWN